MSSRNRDRIDLVEQRIGGDLKSLPGPVGMMLKSVILPQLRAVPDEAAEDMRRAVAHIIEILKEAFELDA